MNLSNIIGKQVFDIYDANFLGTIHDVAFNEKHTKILGLYFFDQDENEFYIKTQNIFSILDFVTIKNISNISNDFLLDKPLSPLGKSIVGTNGKDYGLVSDVEINENYEITNFVSSREEKILPQNIILISKNIVVDENFKISKFRPKKKAYNTKMLNLTVNVMKMEEPDIKQKLMPSKITVNSDILIGKKLSKDIFGKNNELILKQHQVVNTKQVMLAKQHDKLNELFYSVY